MGRKRTPGLVKRGKYWHIEKEIKGYGRLRESCGTDRLEEAERYLAHRMSEIRDASIYGIRPPKAFQEAAIKYLEENQHKRSIERDVYALNNVMPYIGHLRLDRIHNDTLSGFKRQRQRDGVAVGTIKKELSVVRRILILAARVWRHDNGLSWLDSAPLIQMVPGPARKPYPLSWSEQDRFFRELPGHLQRMALFAVNTGCRKGEICGLRWKWQVQVPELATSLFILPEDLTKNGQERIVVLNSVARRVIRGQCGADPEYVFTYKGKPMARMLNTAWRRARDRAGLPQVRVHDLRHTFGHRLRAAGVGYEDRQDLLGHKNQEVTTHYSAPNIARLIEAAEKACERREMTLLRAVSPTKSPQSQPEKEGAHAKGLARN